MNEHPKQPVPLVPGTVTEMIQGFLSYPSLDKMVVGKIKSRLEETAVFELFLAHEDMEPSTAFRETIIERLRRCDFFVPILTRSFNSSQWTGQEIGMAKAWSKIIIPIKVDPDSNPEGFIEELHALTLNVQDISETCDRVFRVVANKPSLKLKAMDGLISAIAKSSSWSSASKRTRLSTFLDEIPQDQLTRLLRVSIDNPEVSGSFDAQKHLHVLMSRFETKIDPELKQEWEDSVREARGVMSS